MADQIRIIIADEKPRAISDIILPSNSRFTVVGECSDKKNLIKSCKKVLADIVIIDENLPGMTDFDAVTEISASSAEVSVILVSEEPDTIFLQEAMISGAMHVITKPLNSDNVSLSIMNVYDKSILKKNLKLKSESNDQNANTSTVLSFFSTKGGVGKTTLAVNTAVNIATLTGERVALLDLDIFFGDIAVMLNFKPRKSLSDAVTGIDNITIEKMDDCMYDYGNNVFIMSAPMRPEEAEYVNSAHIEKLINLLRDYYKYIVIDTTCGFNDITLKTLDLSDNIFFTVTPDLMSIKDVKLGLNIMKSLNYTFGKIKIFLNMSNKNRHVKITDIERFFDKKVDFQIADDPKTILNSINQGLPLGACAKNKGIYKSLLKIAKLIVNKKV